MRIPRITGEFSQFPGEGLEPNHGSVWAIRAPKQIRLLIISEDAATRESVLHSLAGADGITVVSSCGSTSEAIGYLRQQAADVVLLDAACALGQSRFMPRARAVGFRGATLVLADEIDVPEGINLVREGITGICPRSASPAELAESLHLAAQGILTIDERYFRPALMSDASDTPVFTPRQQMVIDLLKRGLSNSQIAEVLEMSVPAIKFILHEIYEVTRVATRGQLLYLLSEEGSSHDREPVIPFSRPLLSQVTESVKLSARQELVMRYLRRGLSNREIAATMGISLPTVKLILRQLYQLTGVRSRRHLVYLLLKGQVGRATAGR